MLRAIFASVLCVAAGSAAAQSAAAGKLYYETPVMGATCAEAACHGPNPALNTRNVRLGANNPTAILNAVDTRPQMAVYRGRITAQNAADLAAYIANPAAAGTPTPTATTLTADATALSFGQTQVGTTNATPMPAAISITNPGTAALTITGIMRGGANADEFTPAGTCVGAAVVVNPGQSCSLTASFTPAGAGTRAGTFTLQSNAATNPTITLSGTAGAAAAPSLALSQTGLLFNAQTLGSTSTARLIGVTNNSTMPVSITATNATPNAEFIVSGGCVITLAPGSSCTMEVSFAPAAAGARTGELAIVSNAAGSPHKIALNGTGVTTPTGMATIAVSALSFPATPVADRAAPQMAVLTNTGNAPLTITAVALTGPNADDFKFGVNHTCVPATLEVDASCRLEAEFRPVSSGGDKTAAIEVTTSAGKASLALTGTVPSATSSSAGSTPATGSSPVRATTQSLLRPSNAGAGAVPWAGLLLLVLAAGLRRRGLARG